MYILGDFNFRDERSLNPFYDVLTRQLLIQIIDKPTRGENMLDLIITNNTNSVISKYVYNPHLSDHSYIECNLSFIRPKVPRKFLTYRNLKSVNTENIVKAMNSVKIEGINSANSATEHMVSKILAVFNKYAPFKNKTILQYPSKKFISQSTKDLIKKRDNAYNVYRYNSNQTNLITFRQLKKKVSAAIYHDTKLEFSNKVQQLHLWGALNKLYPLLNPSPEINISPEEVNSHFVAVSTRNPSTTVPALPMKPPLPWDLSTQTFQFLTLTPKDIYNTLKRMKNRSSISYMIRLVFVII